MNFFKKNTNGRKINYFFFLDLFNSYLNKGANNNREKD